MKKIYFFAFSLFFMLTQAFTQVQKELILNTTGYGFSSNPNSAPHYNELWNYIQKFVNLTYNGQDASITAVRFYIHWNQYEPTLGDYKRTELVQAIQYLASLKGGNMKIALHFPYSRMGFWNDSYFPDSTIARLYDGTKVGDNVANTCPSIFSEWARERFYAFVDDVLGQLGSFYNKILYVQMGNTQAEEFGIPWMNINGAILPGMHDAPAANMWRTQYLPCRYPGQSTVTWDGNTHNISSAPLAAQGQWASWNTEHGREFHRFASWGLMRFYKGFRDVVKNRSSNLKVIYYVSDFGTTQGNSHHMHNASLPMALNEFDGIYTTQADLEQVEQKIEAIDVMKGTNPNKIAAIEFDPWDLGTQYVDHINVLPGVAEEWMPRAYKHGADYVHIAMAFQDPAIETIKPALALIRANYVNGSYQPPSRQSPTTVNVQPTTFEGSNLFLPTWNNLNGNNWSVTDNNPVSINMIDDGYWENIWSCTPTDPCAFTVGASGPTGNVTVNTSITLNASCSGSQCSGVTYSWSGNGISGSGNNISFNAPATAGSYTYTVTASKSGCSNKTATHTVTVINTSDPCDFTVSASGSTGNVTVNDSVTLNASCSGECSGVTYSWSGNGISGSGSSITFSAPGTPGSYTYTVTASKSGCSNETATHIVTVVNGGGTSCSNYSFTDGQLLGTSLGNSVYVRVINSCWYITVGDPSNTPWALDWLYILVNDNGWASGVTPFPSSVVDSCFKQPNQGCSVDPCSFNVSASGPTGDVTVNSSVTLNSSCSGECSGVSYSWSGNGISGSNSSVTFNAPSSPGSYTYTITASKSGCSNKTDTVNINVVSSGGGGSICDNYSFTDGQLLGTSHGNPVYVRVINSCWYITVGDPSNTPWALDWLYILENNNGWAPGVTPFPSSVIDSCFKQPNQGCSVDPCAFNVSASGPTGNVTVNSSVTLNSSCSGECSGTSYAWSGSGASGSGSSITFNAPATAGSYTYTVMATKAGCSNKTATHTITVVDSSTVNCNTAGGFIGPSNCDYISGWAWDESQPNTPVIVEIYEGSTLIQGNILAGDFRQDLLDAYIGNGEHAFSIPTPAALKDGGSHWIVGKIAGCTFELFDSPNHINGCSGSSSVLSPYEEENAQKGIKVFPNPSNGTFETSFYLGIGEKATLVLTDLQGKTLLSKAIVGKGTHLEKINVSNKAAGTMFLRLIKANSVEVKKISVVR